jgi:hypothetical protein
VSVLDPAQLLALRAPIRIAYCIVVEHRGQEGCCDADARKSLLDAPVGLYPAADHVHASRVQLRDVLPAAVSRIDDHLLRSRTEAFDHLFDGRN